MSLLSQLPVLRHLALPGLLALAVVLAYGNSLHGVLLLDDYAVHDSSHFLAERGGLWPSWGAITQPPQLTVSGRPVAFASFLWNYAIDGERLWSYRVTNLLIHLGAVLALFALLRRLFERAGLEVGRGLAFAAALLWAVHPITTAAVSYMVQRCESLCALFYLLALLSAWAAMTRPERTGRFTAFGVALTLLAIGSKEVGASIPIAVLLMDRLSISGSFGEAWRSHRVLHIALFACWIPLAVLVGSAAHSATIGFGFAELDSWAYLRTQAGVLWGYAWTTLWPTSLPFYFEQPIADAWYHWLPQGLGIVLLVAATLYGIFRGHPLALCGAIFFMVLAPSSSLLPVVTEVAALHRMYLPSAVLVVLGVVALRRLAPTPAGIPLLLVATAGLTLATRAQNERYTSEVAIWQYNAEQRPESFYAHYHVGWAQLRARNFSAAAEAFEQATALQPVRYRTANQYRPDLSDAWHNAGVSRTRTQDYAKAAAHLQQAVRLRPQQIASHLALSNAQHALGDKESARQSLQAALEVARARGDAAREEQILERLATL